MDDGADTPEGIAGGGTDGRRAGGGGADGTGSEATAAAGVDHLQAAGREFLAAARSFLDAVESVVEDRSRLGELAESFTGFVGELVETARGGDRTPWGQAVRFDGGPSPDVAGGGVGSPDVPPADPEADAPDRGMGTPGAPSTGAGGAAVDDSGEDVGGVSQPAPRSGRVRRIPVD